MDAAVNEKILKILGILVAVWGLWAFYDIGQRSQAGYVSDGRNTVIRVGAGSGADSAGMKAGDFIVAINGIPSDDAGGMSGIGRADIGEIREFSVRREEEIVPLQVQYGPLSPRQKRLDGLGLLPGFAFLGFCMAAWLGNPTQPTRLLAFAGIGCSLVFLTGPVFSSPLPASVFSILRSGLVLAGFASMLLFLLRYPKAGPFVAHKRNTRVLYVPALLFWLLVSYRTLFPSAGSGLLDTFTYVLSGLVTAFYLLAGIIVFLRRYIRSSGEERTNKGLRLMLWGSMLGFVPAAIGYMPIFSTVPGNEYFFISMVLPPMAWAMAASRAFT